MLYLTAVIAGGEIPALLLREPATQSRWRAAAGFTRTKATFAADAFSARNRLYEWRLSNSRKQLSFQRIGKNY